MEAVIFTGLQASGKSTFYARRFADTHIRINLDMLKTRHRESILLNACLESRQPFVVDNTNVTAEDRSRYIGPAKKAGFKVIGYYFRSSVKESEQRNSRRSERENVPSRAIRGTSGRLRIPSRDEGFDALYYVRIEGDDFSVEEWKDEI